MNIDLSKITEQLKTVSDEELSKALQKSKREENSFCNALMLNGLAKRIPSIDHSETEKFNVIWGQIIIRAYAVLVCMRNDIVESGLMDVEPSSPFHLFKKVFEKGPKNEKIGLLSTESPAGLCRRIRNSIGHGNFTIDGNNGEITFRDRDIDVVVEGYELTKFCEQIERLYLSAPMEKLITSQSSRPPSATAD